MDPVAGKGTGEEVEGTAIEAFTRHNMIATLEEGE